MAPTADHRKARLADQLRANLRKRKAQSRGRGASGDNESAEKAGQAQESGETPANSRKAATGVPKSDKRSD